MSRILRSVRWAFFDLGNTLVDEEDAVADRIHRVVLDARRQGYPSLSEAQVLDSLMQAAGDSEGWFMIGSLLRCGLAERTAKVILEANRYEGDREKLFPSAKRVLELSAARHRIGYIANQSPGLDVRLSRMGIADAFQAGVDSGSFPAHKPQPAIFEEALRRAGCSAAEAVMIGDRVDNDVVPARRLGFRTLRIRQGYSRLQEPRGIEEEPDLTIDGLEGLLELLV